MADDANPTDEQTLEALDRELSDIPVPDVADAVPAPAAPDVPQVVLIGGIGIPQRKLDFEPGVTLGQWLRRADIQLASGQQANVNGRRADVDDVILAGDSITVASRVANGA